MQIDAFRLFKIKQPALSAASITLKREDLFTLTTTSNHWISLMVFIHSITLLLHSPHCQLIPGSTSTCSRCLRWRGEQQMAGLPPSCLLSWENNASLRALIKGGEGGFQSADSWQAACLTSPLSPPCPHIHTAINWHGLRLKYLPGPCKQKK